MAFDWSAAPAVPIVSTPAPVGNILSPYDYCADGLPIGEKVEPLQNLKDVYPYSAKLSDDSTAIDMLFLVEPKAKNCITRLDFQFVLVRGMHSMTVNEKATFNGGIGPNYDGTKYFRINLLNQIDIGQTNGLDLVSWKITKAWGYPLPK